MNFEITIIDSATKNVVTFFNSMIVPQNGDIIIQDKDIAYKVRQRVITLKSSHKLVVMCDRIEGNIPL